MTQGDQYDIELLRVTSEYQSFHYMILRDYIHSSVSSEFFSFGAHIMKVVSLGFIHQNPIKNRMVLLLYSETTIKYKKKSYILLFDAQKMAEIFNQSEQCQT